MRRFWIVAFVLFSIVLSGPAFSQSSNASISGTVTDPSGGVLPGVSVKATNAATGIALTVTSNAAGVYSFLSVQPGMYRVSAEMRGFQTRTFTDVQVGNAAQVRLNFSLEVGQLTETVEVSVAGDRLLLESNSSVGDVLPETKVRELPLTSQNVLDLSKVMGGVIQTNDAIFGEGMGLGGGGTTFAGVSPANVNVQRDGIPMSDVRWPTGINSGTRLNPDLVGEMRMLLAPVDAEAGRGNGQVQVQTKAGGNAYHGAFALNSQNSFLDPNTWANNRSGIGGPYRNLQEYTISAGGPIVKNKTFFFALWDQQWARQRYPRQSLALTPCAQRGIFRYFDNWNNGNIRQATTGGATPTIAVVNADGTPKPPTVNPDGTPHNGILRYASVFGQLVNTPKQADCSDAVVQGPAWDQYRTGMDPTGYISKFIGMTPKVNNYEVGDGLNSAGSRWTQSIRGADNLYGVGEDTQRKQLNVRIDHNFNQKHRVNGSWSYERNWADDTFANWPENSYGGKVVRRPMVFTVNLISTFTPTLLNEARAGMMRNGNDILSPLKNPDVKDKMIALLPKVNGQPMIVGPGDGNINFSPDCFPFCPPNAAAGTPSNPFGGRGMLSYDGFDESSRWTFGDTLSWTKGVHSFKGGGEYRSSGSYGAVGWVMNSSFQSLVPTPFAAGGAATYAPNGITPFTGIPGLAGFFSGNQANMASLLNFLSGSIGSMRQYYYLNSPTQTTWSDYTKEEYPIRDFHQNEWAFFFKDDWKAHENLTLNLGFRWDYYGVPFIKSGMTAGFIGGGSALFGISGREWNQAFWKPGSRADLTQSIFVGPSSPHSDQSVYEQDKNNFGPAVGFAWQLPWFGKGKTTIRGGYQLTYTPAARVSTFADTLGTPPGSVYMAVYNGSPTNPYLSMANLVSPVPIPSGISPMAPIPLTDRITTISAFDPNFRTPYIQNLTLAITRNITSNLSLDVKYIGTLSRKLQGTQNVNLPNFMTNGLLQAFDSARAGGESTLLDKVFAPVRGTQSGATYLRNAQSFSDWAPAVGVYTFMRNDLANGNYANIAQVINYMGSTPGQMLRDAGFPENFIKTNPQFNNANYLTNSDRANYHSFQAQVTLRPVHGISFTGTYTWSKNLGVTGTPTDPLNRIGDYTMLAGNRSHVFVTYGTFDLPFGPGQKLGGNSHGVLARLIEQWQGSWILNLRSGNPLSITAANMLYGNGVPDLVGNFDYDSVGVKWDHGAANGNYFANGYTAVADPQCSSITAELRSACTLQAMALASDKTKIVFQNPKPGTRGNFGRNRIESPGEWTLDMAMSKGVRIKESVNFQLRLDANNIFNHPVPSYGSFASGMRIIVAQPPAVNINDATVPFGVLDNKVGTRTFQITARVNF
jgi:hypothetical protein